jgi:hypothetical protein
MGNVSEGDVQSTLISCKRRNILHGDQEFSAGSYTTGGALVSCGRSGREQEQTLCAVQHRIGNGVAGTARKLFEHTD